MNEIRNYNKKAYTYEELSNQLLERGLQADKIELIKALQNIGYYRLSAYIYPYKKTDGNGKKIDELKNALTLDDVLNDYEFDNELRLLLFSYIRMIEIKFKNVVIHEFSLSNGRCPFSYIDQNNFNNRRISNHLKFLERCLKIPNKNEEKRFIRNFKEKYANNREEFYLPIWMLVELFTLRDIITFFQRIKKRSIKNKILKEYKISYEELVNWLLSLNYVRNVCAHFNRLWNIQLSLPPIIDRFNIANKKRIYSVIVVIKYLLDRIDKTYGKSFKEEFKNLLDKYPQVHIISMGFDYKWEQDNIWN